MSKKPHLRTPFDSEHVRGSQSLVKTAMTALLSYFFITLREIELENISASGMQTVRTVC